MTGFVLEDVSELDLFGFLPLFLTVATVWIIWFVLEKNNPDEITDTPSFLTFIIVVIPFAILNYGGLTIIIYDEMMNLSGGPRSVYLPLVSSSPVIVTGVVIYIGLTVWLWSHWRKLRIRQRVMVQ